MMQSKDQKIAELSQERRKQMEEVVDTAIANWLNQLPNLSEATKQSFRKGVDKLAKVSLLRPLFLFRTQLTKKNLQEADAKNSAWEVICCASAAHQVSVVEIERLRTEVQAKEALLQTANTQLQEVSTKLQEAKANQAPAFASEHNRLNPVSENKKRSYEDAMGSTATSTATTNSVWDDFAALIKSGGD